MQIRTFEQEKDLKYLSRIWQEIGWIEAGDDEEALQHFVQGSKIIGADVNGETEAVVISTPGEMRYQEIDLDLQVVTAVTVSRIARRQGIARRLTAKAIADQAERGILLSSLGMFDQGFYNQLGYGTGSYQHIVSFDPADLNLKKELRPPLRLDENDWAVMHRLRQTRIKKHGTITLIPEGITRAEMKWTPKGFGLGYQDGSGELSHLFWVNVESAAHGPYYISWMVYQTQEQFLELMALIKSLGDQIHLIKMVEPSGIQLQDLLNRPFKSRKVRLNSKFETGIRASAYWQIRILDLEGCLEKTHLNCQSFQFNLLLIDPIDKHLADSQKWRGLTGEYIITLGSESKLKQGFNPDLPTLKTTVGAFSRMWLGVQQASGLSVTDKLTAPPDLLNKLDRAFCLPKPVPDWDF